MYLAGTSLSWPFAISMVLLNEMLLVGTRSTCRNAHISNFMNDLVALDSMAAELSSQVATLNHGTTTTQAIITTTSPTTGLQPNSSSSGDVTLDADENLYITSINDGDVLLNNISFAALVHQMSAQQVIIATLSAQVAFVFGSPPPEQVTTTAAPTNVATSTPSLSSSSGIIASDNDGNIGQRWKHLPERFR